MQKVTITLYQFDELEPSAQSRVIEDNRYINVEYWEWWHAVYDNYENILKSKGYNDIEIQFSGFGRQGDGASFTAEDIDLEKWLNTNGYGKEYKELKNFIDTGELTASIKRSTAMNYVHDMMIDAYFATMALSEEELSKHGKMIEDLEKAITEDAQELSREIYDALETEYEYLTSDATIVDTLRANKYTFEANGEMRNV